MKRRRSLLLILLILIPGCRKRDSEKLIVATAANMQYPMKELIGEFTRQTGIECEAVISSSGILTAQIREGAPFDIFVSADMKYPIELFRDGYTLSEPEIYAYGKLVLWTLRAGLKPSISLLTVDSIQFIALPNPRTAPYGLAAVEVLNQHGIFQLVENKLVYGESISQTSQFIVSGAAEIGFTAKSVVLSPEVEDKGMWIDVAPDDYTPIAQGTVILKNKRRQLRKARSFYKFLFSSKCKEILDKFGYSVPEHE
jgi:molybdate transport system substrate-binding protein